MGSLGLAAGILTLTFFLLFSRPFHLMGWLSSGTVGQPGSSEKEPSLPETEKVLKAVTTSPTLTQPERVKAADHKQGEKTRGADAGPAAPSPQAKEKEAPKSVVVATLPPPPKVPAVPKKKEKEPPEFVDLTKAKLEEQGFSRIKVSLDEKERLIVAGQVKKASQRNEIISLVKSSGFPGKMDFSKLTVQQKVREKVVRPKVVREKPPGPVPTPIKPLGPKLD